MRVQAAQVCTYEINCLSDSCLALLFTLLNKLLLSLTDSCTEQTWLILSKQVLPTPYKLCQSSHCGEAAIVETSWSSNKVLKPTVPVTDSDSVPASLNEVQTNELSSVAPASHHKTSSNFPVLLWNHTTHSLETKKQQVKAVKATYSDWLGDKPVWLGDKGTSFADAFAKGRG